MRVEAGIAPINSSQALSSIKRSCKTSRLPAAELSRLDLSARCERAGIQQSKLLMTTSPRQLDKIDTMPLQDSSTAHHGPPSPAVLRRASSAPEMERKLRTALAIEHQRRVVAEGRAQQIASLSPVEQAMLAAWARTARLLHAPKP